MVNICIHTYVHIYMCIILCYKYCIYFLWCLFLTTKVSCPSLLLVRVVIWCKKLMRWLMQREKPAVSSIGNAFMYVHTWWFSSTVQCKYSKNHRFQTFKYFLIFLYIDNKIFQTRMWQSLKIYDMFILLCQLWKIPFVLNSVPKNN